MLLLLLLLLLLLMLMMMMMPIPMPQDVVYMLQGLGIETGVDLEALMDASDYICAALKRPNRSHVARALAARRQQQQQHQQQLQPPQDKGKL